MNLDDWKAHCERHAGHPIKWNDVKDAYWGMTSWGRDGRGIYSIIPAIHPQCVIIRGDRQVPLWTSSDESKRGMRSDLWPVS